MASNEQRRQVEQLFRQYGRGVGSYVMARVGNADVAETITSNVFLVVLRRIDQCHTSPSAWLWSIVRSELARHFRQHRPTETLEETFRDPALSPPEIAARNEMQSCIREALGRLGDEHQRIIYLKFYLDVPNTGIADELGLSASNVGVIVHRAVKRLRELMEEKTRTGKTETSSAEPGDASSDSNQAAPFSNRRWLVLLLCSGLGVQGFGLVSRGDFRSGSCSLSPALRGEVWGEGPGVEVRNSPKPPLTLTLSPEYRGEGTREYRGEGTRAGPFRIGYFSSGGITCR